MSSNSLRRKRALFRAALDLDEKTQGVWCRTHGIDQSTVSRVLSGALDRDDVLRKVEAWTARTLAKHADAFARPADPISTEAA